MILRQLFHRDLAQSSYLVGCAATGEALIVDPNRDIDQYIELAEREGLRVTAITETHIHADFVSGARELTARTGATLYLSDEGTAGWKYDYAHESGAVLIRDDDTFKVGNIEVNVWHTPGHTPEHLSFLITDTAGADKPMGIFTGDFVFVGDVGRPDLLEKAAGYADTMEDGARQLFQSLQRFKELPDFVQIWPGHGAGSACGKALGAVPQSTVGYERLFNWALQVEREQQFVDAVLTDQPEPPVYFAQMKQINKVGPGFVSDLPGIARLQPDEFTEALNRGDTVIDTRPVDRFAEVHVPGTVNIPFGNGFVTWAGWIAPYDRPFSLIAEPDRVDEVVSELRMIGLDNLAGFWSLEVLEHWEAEGRQLASIAQASVEDLANLENYVVVDVRGATEHAQGHVPGSRNIPLGYIQREIDQIPDDRPVVFHCQSGRRSAIAASLAVASGRKNVHNLTGGLNAWQESGSPVETEREPATPITAPTAQAGSQS